MSERSAEELLAELLRQGGLTARYLTSGVAGLGAAFATPLAIGMNKLNESMGSDLRFPDQYAAVQDLLTEAGLPEPEGWVEKAVGFAAELGVPDPSDSVKVVAGLSHLIDPNLAHILPAAFASERMQRAGKTLRADKLSKATERARELHAEGYAAQEIKDITKDQYGIGIETLPVEDSGLVDYFYRLSPADAKWQDRRKIGLSDTDRAEANDLLREEQRLEYLFEAQSRLWDMPDDMRHALVEAEKGTLAAAKEDKVKQFYQSVVDEVAKGRGKGDWGTMDSDDVRAYLRPYLMEAADGGLTQSKHLADDPAILNKHFVNANELMRWKLIERKTRLGDRRMKIEKGRDEYGLTELYEHPELYGLLPELRETKVRFVDDLKNAAGNYMSPKYLAAKGDSSAPGGLVNIARTYDPMSEFRTGTHEVEHAVQQLTGQQPGYVGQQFRGQPGQKSAKPVEIEVQDYLPDNPNKLYRHKVEATLTPEGYSKLVGPDGILAEIDKLSVWPRPGPKAPKPLSAKDSREKTEALLDGYTRHLQQRIDKLEEGGTMSSGQALSGQYKDLLITKELLAVLKRDIERFDHHPDPTQSAIQEMIDSMSGWKQNWERTWGERTAEAAGDQQMREELIRSGKWESTWGENNDPRALADILRKESGLFDNRYLIYEGF